MQKSITTRLLKSSFLLSLLLHLLVLLSFTVVISYPLQSKEKAPEPEIFIPSYVISGASSSFEAMIQSKQAENPLVKEGLEKAQATLLNDYAANQYKAVRSTEKTDPVHVIGEKLMDDPLRKLLGIALTSRLVYPKVATELHMRGTVSIEVLLFPDGSVTNIRLVKSSGEQVLDMAALRAVHDMSPVHDVGLYIKAPKLLVFNVIF